MSYNAVATKFYNGKEIASDCIGNTDQSEVIERLFGLPVHSYADNERVHDAIQKISSNKIGLSSKHGVCVRFNCMRMNS